MQTDTIGDMLEHANRYMDRAESRSDSERELGIAYGYMNLASLAMAYGKYRNEGLPNDVNDADQDVSDGGGVMYRISILEGGMWRPVLEGLCPASAVPVGSKRVRVTLVHEGLDAPTEHTVRPVFSSRKTPDRFPGEEEHDEGMDDGSWPGWGGD